MTRVIAILLGLAVIVAGTACGENGRMERQQVEGIECIVIENGFGRPKALDCNWDTP